MKISPINQADYKKYANAFNADVLQTFEWGEVKTPEWDSMRLGFYQDRECIALTTILTRKFASFTIGYIPRGPVVGPKGDVNSIFEVLARYIQSIHFAFVLIDPGNTPVLASPDVSVFTKNGFKLRGMPTQSQQTNVIDLSLSYDELLAQMRSKTRQYIRKSEKAHLQCVARGSAHIAEFKTVLAAIEGERGYYWREIGYYKKIMETFGEKSYLFFVEEGSSIVGSVLALTSGNSVYEMFGGMIDKGKRSKASFYLKWKMIQFFKEKGFRYYDQWGTDPRYPGLIQFKNGFGGKNITYLPQYVYVNNPVVFGIYQIVQKIRKL